MLAQRSGGKGRCSMPSNWHFVFSVVRIYFRIQNVECRMWNAECGMWNAECGMWNVKCGMWNVKCEMWNVELFLLLGIWYKLVISGKTKWSTCSCDWKKFLQVDKINWSPHYHFTCYGYFAEMGGDCDGRDKKSSAEYMGLILDCIWIIPVSDYV